MNSFVWIVVIVSSIWVYFDARSIGARKDLVPGFFNLGPLGWALCCLLIWIIAFPAYLIKRDTIKQAANGDESGQTYTTSKQSGVNTAAKFIAVGWTTFAAVGTITAIIGMGNAMPMSGNKYEEAGFAIGATMGLGMWFMIWAIIAVPATIVFLVTKKSATTVVIEQAPQRESAQEKEKTKKCPYCAETIKEEAVFCRFCQKALLAQPDTEIVRKQKSWAEQGGELLRAHDYQRAISAFTSAIEENPTGELYYGRAVAYSKIHDKEKTIADLKKAANFGHGKAKEALGKIGGKS